MNLEMEMINREYRAREEGRIEGRNETRKTIALDMIQMGKSVDEIQMITKLPTEIILELNKSRRGWNS